MRPPHRHSAPGDRHLYGGITILFEDADLIVIDKPSGLLSVPSPLDPGISALDILENYIRKGQIKSRKELYPVHRLDKFTSGVLIFAKSLTMREKMHLDWSNETHKTYVAVVRGRMEKPSGRIESYLAENRQLLVFSTDDPSKGKLAVTEWHVVSESPKYTLLEINPLTGRKNQIRVHLADVGHPIVGDRKYGGGGKGRERLALHAWKISFHHPRDGRVMEFAAPIPPDISRRVHSSAPNPSSPADMGGYQV
jgi:tRNA pseudouridine32 synthase/23S rRNA pseudouridine746 synthase/23S rRNA pseudouridine1911/1915/1917 synthase